MENTIIQLTKWIDDHKKSIKSSDVKILRELDSEVLAKKIAISLRCLLSGAPNFTALAGNIGQLIMSGLEKETDSDKTIRRRRIKIGLEILKVLINNKVLEKPSRPTAMWNDTKKVANKKIRAPHTTSAKSTKIIEERKGKRNGVEFNYTKKVVVEGTFIQDLLIELGKQPLQIYTEPLLFKPDTLTSFSSTETGNLVHSISSTRIGDFNQYDNPVIYDIINKRNQTSFIVNRELLNIFDSVQDDELFQLNEIKPTEEMTPNEKKDIYSAKVSKLRENNLALDSAKTIGERLFYVAHYFDFRGRLYAAPHYFNYQGSKLAKSLHYFTNKKTLGESGWNYLLMHTANCWGEDKLPIQERIAFVEDQLDWILDVANDPINDRSWTEADDAFGFLAAILEIKKAVDSGDEYSFKSGLPIFFDATCSGLQILTALSRDKKTAELCNMLDTDVRGDYYLYVAKKVWEELKKSDSKYAKFWLDLYEHRRSICKRSAMTFFYSAGATTMGEHIYSDHKLKKEFSGITKSSTSFLGKIIYDCCKKYVPGPAKLMELFQTMGLNEGKKDKDLSLTGMVNGFQFSQNYRLDKVGRIKYTHKKTEVKLKYWMERGVKPRLKKIKTASSPNIVHFLDAQFVAGVVMACDFDLITIHDSFGCVPADADKLFNTTREVFVKIFQEDILVDLLKQLGQDDLIPSIEFGDLDINDVLKNQYFIS